MIQHVPQRLSGNTPMRLREKRANRHQFNGQGLLLVGEGKTFPDGLSCVEESTRPLNIPSLENLSLGLEVVANQCSTGRIVLRSLFGEEVAQGDSGMHGADAARFGKGVTVTAYNASDAVCWLETYPEVAKNNMPAEGTGLRQPKQQIPDKEGKTGSSSFLDTTLEGVEDNLADLSHELRTPLNAVIGFAEMMESEAFGPLGHEKYTEYAGLIRKSGRHLLGLVTDLLDISKIRADKYELQRESVHLDELVKECVQLMQLNAQKAGLWLKTDIEANLDRVFVDPRAVRQILLNLLSNAIKFTKQGGVVVSVIQQDHTQRLVISDTGIGMTPDQLASIGQRFTKAQRDSVHGGKGTGLGLALCDALARLHEGQMKVKSLVGHGTTITVSLPVKNTKIEQEMTRLACAIASTMQSVQIDAHTLDVPDGRKDKEVQHNPFAERLGCAGYEPVASVRMQVSVLDRLKEKRSCAQPGTSASIVDYDVVRKKASG